ncbi:MAG: hypothetical protein ABIY63_13225 [Fibrobacteria bacterium]
MAKELMFYEIAEGHFAEQVQKDFVDAQAVAHDRGVPIKIDIQITVFPESRAHRGTGKVKFRSNLKAPVRESIEFITEVSQEGQIVDSGHRQNTLNFKGDKDA